MSSSSESTGSEAKLSLPEKHTLFSGFGIELEYMLVDATTLQVAPRLADVFKSYGDDIISDVSRGNVELSNELVSHVVEFKCARPEKDLVQLEKRLYEEVRYFNQLAAEKNIRLMPTAMHPLMDPCTEMQLWPHDFGPVYDAYNRIFDCRGHGWSNLQSMHINLPFKDEVEFGKLHAAIRLLLPILPAIAASSPFREGKFTGEADHRLSVYRVNQQKVPEITGQVIPEPARTFSDYQRIILDPLYKAIKPHDPEGVLQEEWLNSRGAITRFDRHAIEIRVIDIQECTRADLSIAALVVLVLQELATGKWSAALESDVSQEQLVSIFNSCIKEGSKARIDDAYAEIFGSAKKNMTSGELWQNIFESLMFTEHKDLQSTAGKILEAGTLSERILRKTGKNPDRQSLVEVYARLCDCLDHNELFLA